MDISYIQGEGGFPLKFRILDSNGNPLSNKDVDKLIFKVGSVTKCISDGIDYDENLKLWNLTLLPVDTENLHAGVLNAFLYLTPFNKNFTVCKKFDIRISRGGGYFA